MPTGKSRSSRSRSTGAQHAGAAHNHTPQSGTTPDLGANAIMQVTNILCELPEADYLRVERYFGISNWTRPAQQGTRTRAAGAGAH